MLTCKKTTMNEDFKTVVYVYLESAVTGLAARKLSCTFVSEIK